MTDRELMLKAAYWLRRANTPFDSEGDEMRALASRLERAARPTEPPFEPDGLRAEGWRAREERQVPDGD